MIRKLTDTRVSIQGENMRSVPCIRIRVIKSSLASHATVIAFAFTSRTLLRSKEVIGLIMHPGSPGAFFRSVIASLANSTNSVLPMLSGQSQNRRSQGSNREITGTAQAAPKLK
jgi:hypothetical protein